MGREVRFLAQLVRGTVSFSIGKVRAESGVEARKERSSDVDKHSIGGRWILPIILGPQQLQQFEIVHHLNAVPLTVLPYLRMKKMAIAGA